MSESHSVESIEPFDAPVFVTRPTMPPLEEYNALMARLWETQ